jgi:hypothetical protein
MEKKVTHASRALFVPVVSCWWVFIVVVVFIDIVYIKIIVSRAQKM